MALQPRTTEVATDIADMQVSDAEWEREHPSGSRCRYVWPDGLRCVGEIVEVQEFAPEKTWRNFRGRWSEESNGTRFFKFICSQHGHHDGHEGIDADGTVHRFEKLPATLKETLLAKFSGAK